VANFKVEVLVGPDAFSNFFSGDAFVGHATGVKAVEIYLRSNIYDELAEVTADLQSCFDSKDFKNFMQRKRASFRVVPTNSHWQNKSEKSIHLFKTEFAEGWIDHPDLSVLSAIRLPSIMVNSRTMQTYKMSRKAIHLGRRPSKIVLSDPEFGLSSEPLSVSLAEVESFLNAADQKRSRKIQLERRARLRKAFKQKSFPSDGDVEQQNGDWFVAFPSGVSANT
jgi:hypothetical protein